MVDPQQPPPLIIPPPQQGSPHDDTHGSPQGLATWPQPQETSALATEAVNIKQTTAANPNKRCDIKMSSQLKKV
jgi:hypothetical protein